MVSPNSFTQHNKKHCFNYSHKTQHQLNYLLPVLALCLTPSPQTHSRPFSALLTIPESCPLSCGPFHSQIEVWTMGGDSRRGEELHSSLPPQPQLLLSGPTPMIQVSQGLGNACPSPPPSASQAKGLQLFSTETKLWIFHHPLLVP